MNVIWKGTLTKMRAEHAEPVRYFLRDGFWDASRAAAELPLNELIGANVELRFDGEIRCVYCGRASKKSFGQGFCFPCFRARAEADVWPEKVKSFNLDKAPVAGGRLNGIKGQYLIFDNGVINVRKFTGHAVSVASV